MILSRKRNSEMFYWIVQRGKIPTTRLSAASREAKSKLLAGKLFTQLFSPNSSVIGRASTEMRGSVVFSNSSQFSKY